MVREVGAHRGVARGEFVTLFRVPERVLQLTAAKAGGVWVCAGERVFRLVEGAEPEPLTHLVPDRPGVEARVIFEDRSGAVWVGTATDGLFRCDAMGAKRVETAHSEVVSLAQDAEGKGGVWEGGIRVPLIVRGPGIAANSWSHQRVVGYDFLPTFCGWAGVKTALPRGLEGGDFSHLLTGSTEPVMRAREELVFHFPHYQGDTPHSAILLGNFKLLKFYETGERQLFDLDKDLAERTNLAATQPELAAKLEQRLAQYLKEVGAAMPKPNPSYDPAKEPQSKGGGKGGKGGGKKKEAAK